MYEPNKLAPPYPYCLPVHADDADLCVRLSCRRPLVHVSLLAPLVMAIRLLRRFVITMSWLFRKMLFLHSGKMTLLVAFGVGADNRDVMGLVLGLVAVLYTLSGTVCCHRKAVPGPKVRAV